MENMDAYPFKEPPPDTATLLDLCFRAIAKDFSRYDHDALITDLPFHLVDNLKSYMTPRMLHGIMPFLDKRGIDTSDDWKECELRQQLFVSDNDSFEINDELRKSYTDKPYTKDVFWITERNVNKFHHSYISRHCEKLLSYLFQIKQGESPCGYDTKVWTEKEVLGELLMFLPSVFAITIDLDVFRKLHLEEEIMSILTENIEALMIGDIFADCEQVKLTCSGADRISKILKKFCGSKVLKSIKFQCTFCYHDWQWERENVSLILEGLDASENDKTPSVKEANDDNVSLEEDFEAIKELALYYEDEKDTIQKVDESWTDFQEIWNNVQHTLKYSQLMNTREMAIEDHTAGSLESVSLCINCFLHVGSYLPNWQTVRRLSFDGSVGRNAPSDGLSREILMQIASHQLTHLRLRSIKCDNLVARIMNMFREYYRNDENIERPMEMLDVCLVVDCGKESYPIFENKVHAVKDFRGSCFGLDGTNFSAFLSFFKNNASLTQLELKFQHSSAISCVQILGSLVESNVLENLVLRGSPIAYKDCINKAEILVTFLNQVKTLKKLSLVSFCIEEDTVRSKDLIQAIQNHASLKVLRLGDNDMGTAGAGFLTVLLMPMGDIHQNLTELSLHRCNIPGEELLAAAETLKQMTVRRPLIDTLVIGNNVFKGSEDAGRVFQGTLQREYGDLAKWLHAEFDGYNPHDRTHYYTSYSGEDSSYSNMDENGENGMNNVD